MNTTKKQNKSTAVNSTTLALVLSATLLLVPSLGSIQNSEKIIRLRKINVTITYCSQSCYNTR